MPFLQAPSRSEVVNWRPEGRHGLLGAMLGRPRRLTMTGTLAFPAWPGDPATSHNQAVGQSQLAVNEAVSGLQVSDMDFGSSLDRERCQGVRSLPVLTHGSLATLVMRPISSAQSCKHDL